MKKLLVCLTLVSAACNKDDASKAAPRSASDRVEIAVTDKGFEPGEITVPSGKPVTIVFNRKTDQTCAKQIVLNTGDGKKIEKDLPLNTPVEIAATFAKAGKVGYACAMDMMKGTISVE